MIKKELMTREELLKEAEEAMGMSIEEKIQQIRERQIKLENVGMRWIFIPSEFGPLPVKTPLMVLH
jgi:hypothetical protein